MTPNDYISQTEHAVRQHFESLTYYQKLLLKVNPPMLISNAPEISDVDLVTWSQENHEEIERYREAQRAYLGVAFSMQIICGGILQVAHMGIDMYSPQKSAPISCCAFSKKIINPKVIRFCAGREIRGLPLGLIVYAGRNQCNHWDDPTLSQINTEIFKILSQEHGDGQHLTDPAFDLQNSHIDIYSHNILALLEWQSYERYEYDLKNIIC